MAEANKKNEEEKLLNKFRNAHGDKFEYLNLKHTSMQNKIEIKCKKHNKTFNQTIKSHLLGVPCCEDCRDEIKFERFIKKAKKIHGDKYTYNNKLIYQKNRNIKISIICPEHGEFYQKKPSHLEGHGCPSCGRKITGRRKDTTESFIEKAKKIHDEKYNYTKTKYTGCKNDVIIECPEHGEFSIQAFSHSYHGSGCPRCPTLKDKKIPDQ